MRSGRSGEISSRRGTGTKSVFAVDGAPGGRLSGPFSFCAACGSKCAFVYLAWDADISLQCWYHPRIYHPPSSKFPFQHAGTAWELDAGKCT